MSLLWHRGSALSDQRVADALAEAMKTEWLDLLIDGADEVDRNLNVMKGSRGAMTRERMLAWACRHSVFMVGENKVSDQIGTKASLAVAVMAFGLASIRAALRDLGLNGVCRREMNGDLFVTDNGNLLLDLSLRADENLSELAAALNDIPGVVDHGLFLCEADEILIETDRGAVERLAREDETAN